ncbi:MAG: PTS sugar transporter subunit IIB [Deltaproteobacteria bacterium]
MIILVRVDDRLLHGQVICSWVPFVRADTLIVASDEAASDELASEIIESCGHPDLSVDVKSIGDVIHEAAGDGPFGNRRVILIVGCLEDAMRVYEEGVRFPALNIGNIHHHDGGRNIAPSVILNSRDEELIAGFIRLGVTIDIRDIPKSDPAGYTAREKDAG